MKTGNSRRKRKQEGRKPDVLMAPAEKFRPKGQDTSYPLSLAPSILSHIFLWTRTSVRLECAIVSLPGKASFNDLLLNIYTEACCIVNRLGVCLGNSHLLLWVSLVSQSVLTTPLTSVLSSGVHAFISKLTHKIRRHALFHAWFHPLSMTGLKLIPVPACKHYSRDFILPHSIPLCE